MAAVKIADLFARIGFKVDDKQLRKFEKNVDGASKKVGGFSRTVQKASGALVGFFGVMAATDAIKALFQVGVELDSINNSLFAVIGNTEGVADAWQFLGSESDRLGLNLRTVSKAYSQLTAATKGTTLEGEPARELFTAMSEASTVLGLSADQTKGAMVALQQIISKGKVSAEELRQQLGERLPGAFQISARAIGKTTTELDKMLQQGALLSEDFIPKFTKQLKKEFAAGLTRAVNSAQARFNRFSNTIFRFQTKLVKSGFLDVAIEALEGVTELLKLLNPLAIGLGFVFRLVGAVFKATSRLIIFLLKPLGTMFEAFEKMPLPVRLAGTAMLAFAIATSSAAAAMATFIARFLLIPAIIIGIVLVAEDLIVALKGGKSAIRDMTESANPLINAVGSIALAFGELFGTIGELIGFLLAGAPGGFDEFFNIISEGMGRIKELFQDEVTLIVDFFFDAFKTIGEFFDKIIEESKRQVEKLSSVIILAFNNIKDFFIGLFNDISNLLSRSIDDAVRSAIDILPDFIKGAIGIEDNPLSNGPSSASQFNRPGSSTNRREINVGGITNEIIVPPGTSQEQQSSITEQVNNNMVDFMNKVLIDAQAEVPEAL